MLPFEYSTGASLMTNYKQTATILSFVYIPHEVSFHLQMVNRSNLNVEVNTNTLLITKQITLVIIKKHQIPAWFFNWKINLTIFLTSLAILPLINPIQGGRGAKRPLLPVFSL